MFLTKNMPAAIHKLTNETLASRVYALAAQVRQRRKVMGVSVATAAEAAGMSRDTWYRLEKGETTVTIGAWFNALSVLGMEFGVGLSERAVPAAQAGRLPVTIRVADFPQLAALAWQLPGRAEVSPREALDIYERNGRFLDPGSLSDEERELIENLKTVLGPSGNV